VTSKRGPRSVEAGTWGTLPGPGFVEAAEEAGLHGLIASDNGDASLVPLPFAANARQT